MSISSSDTTLALRISGVIQAYFEKNGIFGPLRSTEVYEILAKEGVIERDRHQGIKLRQFLNRLRRENQLYLIPQCRFEETSGHQVHWFFESAPGKQTAGRKLVPLSHAIKPKTLDRDDLKTKIQELKKRNDDAFNRGELELRKIYPRAYEFWSKAEEELLLIAAKEIQDHMELSRLFGRQPSAIERRLNKLENEKTK